MLQGFLFEPEAPPFRTGLAAKLSKWADRGVYFGTSSWKYEGWLGSVYTEERYLARGRFSQRQFDDHCLAEYAETFPAVCGDFTFYQFPSPEYWRKLFSIAPPGLRFGFKAPEDLTCKVFPEHPRYGSRGGLDNPSFLDAALFGQAFADPLAPYRDRVGVIIFEFGTFARTTFGDPLRFLAALDPFLGKLPGGFRYAVEIRNREFLGADYFMLLRAHGVAHVFNSWTRMPDLSTQLAMPDAITADFAVARALLKPGRPYEEAVRKFQPYREVQEPCPPAREGLASLASEAVRRKIPAFLFVNNRLEGNAPGTIDAVLSGMDD